MSRAKGNRIVRERAIPFYENLGYWTEKVEQVGTYITSQDMFARLYDEGDEFRDTGFDIVALKGKTLILCQVTTNSPKTQKWYKYFAQRHAHEHLRVHVLTWYDRDGFRLQEYMPEDGTINETDLRKSRNADANSVIWYDKETLKERAKL